MITRSVIEVKFDAPFGAVVGLSASVRQVLGSIRIQGECFYELRIGFQIWAFVYEKFMYVKSPYNISISTYNRDSVLTFFFKSRVESVKVIKKKTLLISNKITYNNTIMGSFHVNREINLYKGSVLVHLPDLLPHPYHRRCE